jgi:hypothetical protein
VWEVQLSPDFNKEDYLKRMDAIITNNIDTYGKFKQTFKGKEINYAERIRKSSSRFNK